MVFSSLLCCDLLNKPKSEKGKAVPNKYDSMPEQQDLLITIKTGSKQSHARFYFCVDLFIVDY